MRNLQHEIHVGPHVEIFHEQDVCDGAYVIERGSVEVSVMRDGRKIVLGRRGIGEVFGEMAIIDERPRSATITTLEPCRLLRITREQLHNRISQADPILRMYLGIILDRFRDTLEDLQTLAPRNGQASSPQGRQAGGPLNASNDYAFAINEIKLEEELNDALRHGDFVLHYQPIVDLHDRRIVGFESLLRWQHSERGLLLPVEFLQTAEISGLIVPIGAQVFRNACDFLSRLNAHYPARHGSERPFVSVNISARDFGNSRYVDEITRMARAAGVRPEQLKLEVTETALITQTDVVAEVLEALRAHGFSIAIDDFGTGYSSLSYLHKFPFDTLKIDRAFVQNLHDCEKNNEIVASIATLANHLNLSVIAEGVETLAHERIVRDLDCAFAQGFLYARPMPERHIAQFVADWNGEIAESVTGS